jgi:hypothetical protein
LETDSFIYLSMFIVLCADMYSQAHEYFMSRNIASPPDAPDEKLVSQKWRSCLQYPTSVIPASSV